MAVLFAVKRIVINVGYNFILMFSRYVIATLFLYCGDYI